MRISKEVMSGALEIFDKHFPNEKNTPIKEKKKIVKFFFKLNNFCIKHNTKLTKEHIELLQEKI